jgi:hypothetical protein
MYTIYIDKGQDFPRRSCELRSRDLYSCAALRATNIDLLRIIARMTTSTLACSPPGPHGPHVMVSIPLLLACMLTQPTPHAQHHNHDRQGCRRLPSASNLLLAVHEQPTSRVAAVGCGFVSPFRHCAHPPLGLRWWTVKTLHCYCRGVCQRCLRQLGHRLLLPLVIRTAARGCM